LSPMMSSVDATAQFERAKSVPFPVELMNGD
jgi:hypothetical protein